MNESARAGRGVKRRPDWRGTGWGRGVAAGGLLAMLALAAPKGGVQTTHAPAPTLEEAGRVLAKAESVFTRFVQERHLSLFTEPLRSEGFLCFRRPGLLRWEITQPYRSILVSDGAGVAQFEWVDDKWKKLDLGLADAMQNVVRQIAGVMEGRYASRQGEHEATLTNTLDGPVVVLVPRHEKMRKMMKCIEVHLAPGFQGTRRVVLRENGGDFTDIRFSDQTVGVPFPAKTFDREAPLDLEQVRRAVSKPQSRGPPLFKSADRATVETGRVGGLAAQ